MTDKHTPAQRSYNMSRIRKFGNVSTEGRMVDLFRKHGITGWRRHLDLPGRPDFAFPSQRVVLFVDGCFWHRCPRCNWAPSSNIEYWERKFATNVARDREADRRLRQMGWRVVRIWEHSLKQPGRVVARVRRVLSSRSPRRSPP